MLIHTALFIFLQTVFLFLVHLRTLLASVVRTIASWEASSRIMDLEENQLSHIGGVTTCNGQLTPYISRVRSMLMQVWNGCILLRFKVEIKSESIFRLCGPRRYNIEQGTRLIAGENVVTGNIHEACSRTFSRTDAYDVRVLHTQPCDTGFGVLKRFRGWNLDDYSILQYTTVYMLISILPDFLHFSRDSTLPNKHGTAKSSQTIFWFL